MIATEKEDSVTNSDIILKIERLKMYFPITSEGIFQRQTGSIKAVDGLDFFIQRGKTLGLVGESGCGKSTTGQAILQLYRPTSGSIIFDGEELCDLRGERLRRLRRRMQIVFQDTYAAMNPRMTIGDSIVEPLIVHGLAKGKLRIMRVYELLEMVGISSYFAQRYPHELSGGQLQRVGIARALAVEPEFIVCDEPVSALDVSIQSQIINLLEELQGKLGLTYLFISHDLSVVRHISDEIAVMYLGKIVELANRVDLYHKPLHPYTQALLSAVPIPDPDIEEKRERILLTGDVPSPSNPPSGCRFRTRCHIAKPACAETEPAFREVETGHWAACIRI